MNRRFAQLTTSSTTLVLFQKPKSRLIRSGQNSNGLRLPQVRAEQPRHGYSILKDVEQMSRGSVLLSTGTLYGALRRLLDDRWIERYQDDDTSRGKQAYRLTSLGRKNLRAEIFRMKHLTRPRRYAWPARSLNPAHPLTFFVWPLSRRLSARVRRRDGCGFARWAGRRPHPRSGRAGTLP